MDQAEAAPSKLIVQVDREEGRRWIAEVLGLPAVMVYGRTRDEVLADLEALTLGVLADRLEHGEDILELSRLCHAA